MFKKSLLILGCAILLFSGCGQTPKSPYEENECIVDLDDMGQIEFIKLETTDINVNFAQPDGLPLIKKISQFTIGSGDRTDMTANSEYLDALNAPTMRYPLSMWGTEYSEKFVKTNVDIAYDNAKIFTENGTPVMYWHIAEVQPAYDYEYGDGNPRYTFRV